MSERSAELIGRVIGGLIYVGLVMGLMYWMGAPRWACIGIGLLSLQLAEIKSGGKEE